MNNSSIRTYDTKLYCTANMKGFEQLLFVVLNVLSSCLTIIGNAAVLFTVYSSQTLRTVSNFFICSLSIADFLVGALIKPLYITIVVLGVWVTNHPLYLAENYLWIQSLSATTFTLAAISVDRYLAVTKVFRYEEIMTERRCTIILISIWAFSFLFASKAFIIHPKDASKLWVASTVITVCIPLAIISYCYFYIFKAAQTQWRNTVCVTNPNITNQEEIQQSITNRKAAMYIAIIIGFFIILYTPNFVTSIIEICTEDHCRMLFVYRVWLWAIWLSFLSSACNPWIYAVRNRRFRKAFRRIWRRCCCRTNEVMNINNS